MVTQTLMLFKVPKRKPQLLKESQPKEVKPLAVPRKYVAFTDRDSWSVEAAYQKLADEYADNTTRHTSSKESRQPEAAIAGEKENTSIDEAGQNLSGKIKVPVHEDFLFDVDVERRELAPVYWLGPIYEVRRGSWFYQEGSSLRACDENLAAQLEEGYLKVKPFRYPKGAEPITKPKTRPTSVSLSEEPKPMSMSSVFGRARNETGSAGSTPNASPKPSLEDLRAESQHNLLSSSASKDVASPPAHQPQTHRLFGQYMNSVVTYQDATIAWLLTDDFMSRMSSTVYRRFAGGGYLGGVKIVRGYTDPVKTKEASVEIDKRPATPVAVGPGPSHQDFLSDEKSKRSLKRQSAPPGTMASPIIIDDEIDATAAAKPDTRRAALERTLSNLAAEDGEQGVEEAREAAEQKDMREDYLAENGEDQGREIEHVILVTHGIGMSVRFLSYESRRLSLSCIIQHHQRPSWVGKTISSSVDKPLPQISGCSVKSPMDVVNLLRLGSISNPDYAQGHPIHSDFVSVPWSPMPCLTNRFRTTSVIPDGVNKFHP